MKANIPSVTIDNKRFLVLYQDYRSSSNGTIRCHCIDTETGSFELKDLSLHQKLDDTVFELTLLGKLVTETKLVSI